MFLATIISKETDEIRQRIFNSAKMAYDFLDRCIYTYFNGNEDNCVYYITEIVGDDAYFIGEDLNRVKQIPYTNLSFIGE